MAAEAAVPTEVGAAAFMAAVEVRIAAAECLAAAARHAAAAPAAAGLTAADAPQVQATLSAAGNQWDAPARWDVREAAQAGRAARRQLMLAAQTDSAEAVPATRAPRAAQATVLPMASGIPLAEPVAAQDRRAVAPLPPDAVAQPAAIFTRSAALVAERVA